MISFFYCDAHNHLNNLKDIDINIKNLSCCLSKEEFLSAVELKSRYKDNVFLTYGIHPLQTECFNQENKDFLLDLCKSKQINAIGECGFDLFTAEGKSNLSEQLKIWDFQIVLANEFNLPMVIHDRKGLSYIMQRSKELKKLKAVIFHNFSYTSIEAKSLLNKGINAYFSFGKSVFNNGKKMADCFSNLPLEYILLETDAPYQCSFDFIKDIYQKASQILNISVEQLSEQLALNFNRSAGV